MSFQRYLEGTAYIVYGPGPEPENQCIRQLHSKSFQDHENSRQDLRLCHDHRHDHHEGHQDSQSHFWIVFRADQDIKQQQPYSPDDYSKNDGNNNNKDTKTNRCFVLKGTPHPWGSYPSDMPPPHGCIPPHLYYEVVISEYDYDENEYRYSNIKEWIIPFVHRIGDGKDDAGGLTSAYTILQDLEDADDYGAFLEHKLQRSPLDDDVDSTSTNNNSYNNNNTPSLYACTQVLISEQRTLQVLERRVFNSSRTNNGSDSKCSDRSRSNADNENYSGSTEGLPKALHELQGLLKKHPAKDTTTLTSVQLPYCVLKSDMKIILPNP